MPERPPQETGDFIRIFTEEESYPSRIGKGNGTENIRSGSPAYLKFNLERLINSDTDTDDIKSVRLRFTFLKGSGEITNRIKVNLADDTVWGRKYFNSSPFIGASRELAVLYPQTKGAEDSLSEIDITSLVKEYLSSGKTQISFNLAADMQIGVQMATGEFYDSAYRPYMKIVTGDAEDTDAYTFKRAELSEAVYVSQSEADKAGVSFAEQNRNLLVGAGNEAYLKFDLNENSIFDTVYNVRLSLCQKSEFKDSKFKIYCVNNNQWSGNITYNTLPRGEETIAAEVTSEKDGRLNIDITGAVTTARTLGIKSLTLRIVGDEQPIEFYGKGDERHKPALYISATDDKNISCVANAGLNALGANPISFVTMNLDDSYTSEDGTFAKIRWREFDIDGREITDRHISENGTVKRPKWFEPHANVIAEAKIQSGNYSALRRYYVTVPSTAAPNYGGYTFSNYIDIGNSTSEDEQQFDSTNISGTKYRWTSGRMFSYRVPDIDGAMLLNMACMPDTDNYITLKLWEGDGSSYCDFVLSVCDEKRQTITLGTPDDSIINDTGFVYATYKLPREFTSGKNFVSLCLSCRENSPDTISIDSYNPRGVYAAYMTQSSFFNPKAFVKQGEKSISEPNFGEEAIRKFIKNLQAISIPADDKDLEDHLITGDNIQKATLSKENGTAVFAGEEANIAFSLNRENHTADIYQKTEYFDRYSSGCPVIFDGDLAVVDYGDYKMIWNRSETEAFPFPYRHLEVSGVYKEITGNNYYTFSEEWQMTDDSVIPDDKIVANGRDIIVVPNSAILLMHIADPMHKSDWRVSRINGKLASEFTFREGEALKTLTAKAVGGVSGDADTISAIITVYDNDKLTAIYRKELDISDSVNIYTMDFSDYDIVLQKGRTVRVFVFDNNLDMTELNPVLEIS